MTILEDIKAVNDIEPSDTAFDTELLLYINSVLWTLNQLGVGYADSPAKIQSSTEWSEVLSDRGDLETVKTYVGLKVKLMFDLTGTSYVIAAIEKQCSEMEWRMEVYPERIIT